MERLKHIKESLISCVQSQMGDLNHVDTHELGEAIDMIKDMEEAIYYCSISKAMEKKEEEDKHSNHMPQYVPFYVNDYYNHRDMDREYGRMYFEERNMMDRGMRSRDESGRYLDRGDRDRDRNNEYRDSRREQYPMEIRDVREGKSPISRKNYMESKELHQGMSVQMKELEKYLQELSQDITEMIRDASPEEKAVLQQKLSTLATKIK